MASRLATISSGQLLLRMKPRLALSLLFVASLTTSRAAQHEPILAGDAPRPAEPAIHKPIVLGDKNGRVRMDFQAITSGKRGIGAVGGSLHGEINGGGTSLSITVGTGNARLARSGADNG